MKKLTHGGGVPMILSLIALILSLVASFQEYLFRFIYNIAFDADAEKIFVGNIAGYFTMTKNDVPVISMYTEKAFILAIISLAAFLIFVLSGKKKTIVGGEAIMLIAASGACLIEPVMYVINFLSGDMKDGLSSSNDGERFRCFYGLLIYALPMLISVLLIVAGLIILGRVAAEKNKVEVARKGAVAAVAAPVFAQPMQPQTAQNGAAMMDEIAVPAVEPVVAQQADETFAMFEEKAAEAEAVIEEKVQQADETVGMFEEKAAEVEAVIEEAPKAVFCATCGNQLDPNAKFCNNCGTKR